MKNNLILSRQQYKSLHCEIDIEREMRFARADCYAPAMRGFITQLNTAVRHNRPAHAFNVSWGVADAIGGDDYTVSPVFSSLFMEIIRDGSQRIQG